MRTLVTSSLSLLITLALIGEVAGLPDMVGLDAKMILELWDAGEWDTSIP